MKRVMDVSVSIVSMFLLSPLFLVLSLLIILDGGPIFFMQTRVGLNGVPFRIYKFRSMLVNADKFGGYSTTINDPRITLIGKFIRKTSLDEIPQLLNVLKGEMSLVGPRPNVPEQKQEYLNHQWVKRNSVKPGITGLAQATHRSNATWQQRFELDIEYVVNASLLLDLKIIVLTIKQIFSKGGY